MKLRRYIGAVVLPYFDDFVWIHPNITHLLQVHIIHSNLYRTVQLPRLLADLVCQTHVLLEITLAQIDECHFWVITTARKDMIYLDLA